MRLSKDYFCSKVFVIVPAAAICLAIIDTTPSIKLASLVEQVAAQAPQFTTQQLVQGATTTLTAMAKLGVIVTKNPP